MFFARKRSGSGKCFLRESAAAAATQHDVGHSVVATGSGVLKLSSSISANVWTPAEKRLKTLLTSPQEVSFCYCRFTFVTKTLAERS
ncbi:hypothetical protein [Lysinibacillus xylanilyticus]|uniref:hypothetical protein n=1 Tax=Lysinibacillus xylanilyticus TaxID=582475 RepID=UPI003D04A667